MISLPRLASILLVSLSSSLGAEEITEFTIGPDYTDAPETRVADGVPRGKIHEFVMDSADSRIYRGIAKDQRGRVPYKRKVVVYVPAGYDGKSEIPFIIAQDGNWYHDVLPKVLDNLIAEKRVPAMVAIMIDSGGGDGPGSQRGLEYDTVSDTYGNFVEREVLPRVSKECDVKFSRDPKSRATMGGSSGAAAAFTMAWFHPDRYSKVLSYSGTYTNQQSPPNRKAPHGAWEYHENFLRRSAVKPLRIWLHVSENDNGKDRDEASMKNWVLANQRMAEQLKDRGYEYRYVFAKNAGHIDGKVTSQTLPGALEWLWEGHPVD